MSSLVIDPALRKVGAIVAMDEAGGIGKGGELPWHYPEDLRHFRSKTLGGVVVMGRNTWDSLGHRPLKRRINIVITSQPEEMLNSYYANADLQSDPVEFYDNPFSPAIYDDSLTNTQPLWYIGGASIYSQTLQAVNTLWVTRIPAKYDCDAFFPGVPEHLTKISSEETTEGLIFEEYRWISKASRRDYLSLM